MVKRARCVNLDVLLQKGIDVLTQSRYGWVVGVMLAIASADSQSANADLYQIYIHTTEWLIDNSDVIVVVSGENDKREVQHVFKGDPATLSKNLVPYRDSNTYLKLQTAGESRLLFVRGKSELLEEIGLGRKEIEEDVPPLLRVLYGVTRYGQLITSESDLFTCVEDRIKSGHGTPLQQLQSRPHAERSGVTARTDFPLESTDHTYVLIVPITVARRDHYLEDLRAGDAVTRIRALFELSQFDDPTSRNAIKAAIKSRNVRPSVWRTRQEGFTMLTSKDVINAAKKALKSELYFSP